MGDPIADRVRTGVARVALIEHSANALGTLFGELPRDLGHCALHPSLHIPLVCRRRTDLPKDQCADYVDLVFLYMVRSFIQLVVCLSVGRSNPHTLPTLHMHSLGRSNDVPILPTNYQSSLAGNSSCNDDLDNSYQNGVLTFSLFTPLFKKVESMVSKTMSE